MKPNEFFNSAENLADLVHNNILLRNSEGLLFYRKSLGHSNEFDRSKESDSRASEGRETFWSECMKKLKWVFDCIKPIHD